MYKFTKIDNDTTKLECEVSGEQKEFEIKKTVELLKELTSATHRSRNRLIKDLAKEGLTKSDLVKEVKKDGKTAIAGDGQVTLGEQVVLKMFRIKE